MAAHNVPISELGYRLLQQLATQTGRQPEDALDVALDEYQRKVFLDAVNEGYAALRADPEAWAEELAERELWDSTLLDGLDPNEHWSADGRCHEGPHEGTKVAQVA